MNKFTFSSWNKLLGVDFGSSRIRLWSSDQPDLIVNQPSCIAIDSRTAKVLAVGAEAQMMEGRVSKHISIIYPIQKGVVYDLDAAIALLKVLIRQSFSNRFSLSAPSAMVVVPASATDVEKHMFAQVVEAVGVREVLTIVQPLAASIGAGVPIADSSGTFIVQMGGGVVEVAVISLGSIVACQSTSFAGETLVENIQYLLKQQLSLEISKETAEQILMKIVSVKKDSGRHHLIAGQHLQTGSPTEFDIEAPFFAESMLHSVTRYQHMVQKLLSKIPPELTVDSIDKGILLSGGLAQLHGFDEYLVNALGIPVSLVDNPQETSIRGVMTALKHLDLFKESLGYLE